MPEPFYLQEARAIQAHLTALRFNRPFITDEFGGNPRTGLDFYKSVLAYLDWRSGSAWRLGSTNRRNHYYYSYCAAHQVLVQAFYSTKPISKKKPRAASAGVA